MLVLRRVLFWAMPNKDIEEARVFWEEIRTRIRAGKYDEFRKMGEKRIFHVRPKGANKKDLMQTAEHGLQKKKCYWINALYIKQVLAEK